MYKSGAKASNSQNLKSTSNSLNLPKNVVRRPPVQLCSVASAAFTKTTATLTTSKIAAVKSKCTDPEKPTNHVIKSKFTENKSTKKTSQIPFNSNRSIKLSKESTFLNIQGIKSEKSLREFTTIKSISGEFSGMSKRDSRKDIYNSLATVDQNIKSQSNVPSIGEPLRTKTSRSLSATTSVSNPPLRRRNIDTTQQNICKNLTNVVPLIKGSLRPKNVIAKGPNQIRSLSAKISASNTPVWKRNIQIPTNENLKITNEELSPRKNMEIAIQTNEGEIMNHSLIVGDLKIMKPSKSVIEEIENLRLQIKTKQLLKATRTFEEHSARDEKHLNDLNEFLEKSYVTKKEHKVQGDLLQNDLKLIASMDELLNRPIRKTESITDIRARIKRKEQELLSLFDKVPNISLMSNKN